MKKSIWIVLPIIIIAVVLVAVFAGQRNTLSDQIAQLESDKVNLTKQLDEAAADAEAKKAAEAQAAELSTKLQEAETRVADAESKIADAEGKAAAYESRVKEVSDQLSNVTEERDALQTSANAAAEQLPIVIKQAQTALEALVGPTDDELTQAKAALASAQETVDQITMELQQTQEALSMVIGERDDLKIAYENAAAQIADIQALSENLKVARAGVRVCDAEGNVLREYDDVSLFSLTDLQPGEFIVIVLYNAAGEAITQYSVTSAVPAAEEAPAEAPAEEAPAEEAPAA